MGFVHLHTHSEYSLLDGGGFVEDYAVKAAKDGQPALAVTDHGNMFAMPDFFRACKKNGIKPIAGIEAYAAHDIADRPKRKKAGDAYIDHGTS